MLNVQSLEIASEGYSAPPSEKGYKKYLDEVEWVCFMPVRVPMMSGNFISPHDQLISQKMAKV